MSLPALAYLAADQEPRRPACRRDILVGGYRPSSGVIGDTLHRGCHQLTAAVPDTHILAARAVIGMVGVGIDQPPAILGRQLFGDDVDLPVHRTDHRVLVEQSHHRRW